MFYLMILSCFFLSLLYSVIKLHNFENKLVVIVHSILVGLVSSFAVNILFFFRLESDYLIYEIITIFVLFAIEILIILKSKLDFMSIRKIFIRLFLNTISISIVLNLSVLLGISYTSKLDILFQILLISGSILIYIIIQFLYYKFINLNNDNVYFVVFIVMIFICSILIIDSYSSKFDNMTVLGEKVTYDQSFQKSEEVNLFDITYSYRSTYISDIYIFDDYIYFVENYLGSYNLYSYNFKSDSLNSLIESNYNDIFITFIDLVEFNGVIYVNCDLGLYYLDNNQVVLLYSMEDYMSLERNIEYYNVLYYKENSLYFDTHNKRFTVNDKSLIELLDYDPNELENSPDYIDITEPYDVYKVSLRGSLYYVVFNYDEYELMYQTKSFHGYFPFTIQDILRIEGYQIRIDENEKISFFKADSIYNIDVILDNIECSILIEADNDFCYITNEHYSYYNFVKDDRIYIIKYTKGNMEYNSLNTIDTAVLEVFKYYDNIIINNYYMVGINWYFYYSFIFFLFPLLKIDTIKNNDYFERRYKKHDY